MAAEDEMRAPLDLNEEKPSIQGLLEASRAVSEIWREQQSIFKDSLEAARRAHESFASQYQALKTGIPTALGSTLGLSQELVEAREQALKAIQVLDFGSVTRDFQKVAEAAGIATKLNTFPTIRALPALGVSSMLREQLESVHATLRIGMDAPKVITGIGSKGLDTKLRAGLEPVLGVLSELKVRLDTRGIGQILNESTALRVADSMRSGLDVTRNLIDQTDDEENSESYRELSGYLGDISQSMKVLVENRKRSEFREVLQIWLEVVGTLIALVSLYFSIRPDATSSQTMPEAKAVSELGVPGMGDGLLGPMPFDPEAWLREAMESMQKAVADEFRMRAVVRDAPIRVEPSGGSIELCRVAEGEMVFLLSEDGAWSQVEVVNTTDGPGIRTGWLHRRHLSK